MPVQLGVHAPRIAAVRRLREARERRERGIFAFEGAELLEEAGRSRLQVEGIYATPAAYERYRSVVRAHEDAGVPVYIVPERAFERISDLESPSGLLATAPIPALSLAEALSGDGPILVLAALNDPGNAGTLVRSADAFGIGRVVFGAGGVDPYHPKVVRAAMGSLFRARVAVSQASELDRAARAVGRSIVAADRSGTPLPRCVLPGDALFVVGNERRGALAWLERADTIVSIPQTGEAESLNAAVAGSILLYAATVGRTNVTS